MQDLLGRLYAGWGVRRYIRAFYPPYVAACAMLCALAVGLFNLYVDMTIQVFLETLVLAEAGILTTLALGIRSAQRALRPAEEWAQAGKSAHLAPRAWAQATSFTVRSVVPQFIQSVLIGVLPVLVFGTFRFDLEPLEALGVGLTMVIAGLYPAILFAGAHDAWLRPMVRELALQLRPEDVPPGMVVSLRLRLYVALPIIGVSAVFFSVIAITDRNSLNTLAVDLSVALVIGVVATIVVVALVAESLLAPVGELVSATRRVRRGDFSTQVPVLFSDELGALARGFNEMTADLQRAREQEVLAREEERRRVARDLHDGLGPTLAASALNLARLSKRVEDPVVRAELEELRGDLRATVGDVRRLVYELRPPALDDMGLVAAIERAAAAFARGEQAPEVTVTAAESLPTMPAAVEVAALRIAQEALNNAVRHAGATTCHVDVRVNGALEIEVRDDGCGLDLASVHRGVGLGSMRERAGELGGTLEIGPAQGGGTVVRARLPMEVV